MTPGILAVIQGYLHHTFGHAKRNDVRDLASTVIIKDDVTGFAIGEQQIDHVPLDGVRALLGSLASALMLVLDQSHASI